VCVYIYIHVYTCMYTDVYIYICVCIYIYMYIYIYIYIYVYIHIYLSIYICIHTYVYVHVYEYIIFITSLTFWMSQRSSLQWMFCHSERWLTCKQPFGRSWVRLLLVAGRLQSFDHSGPPRTLRAATGAACPYDAECWQTTTLSPAPYIENVAHQWPYKYHRLSPP
jgi:hypothetical protein